MAAAGAARASAAAGAGLARPARTMAMQAGISAIRPGYLEEVASPAMRPATTARDGVTVSKIRTAHRQVMATKNVSGMSTSMTCDLAIRKGFSATRRAAGIAAARPPARPGREEVRTPG